MAIGNIKRAFNRLFIVVTIAWGVYCTVFYPLNERRKATDHYEKDMRGCYEVELGQGDNKLSDCLKEAEVEWRISVDQFSFKNFYLDDWWLIVIAIAGLPLLVYGLIRGATATCIWIWRGYKTEART
jgi:hypothetical protein